MKASKVYLEAARLIDNGSQTFSCSAVLDVLHWEPTGWANRTLTDYTQAFGDSSGLLRIAAVRKMADWAESCSLECRELRVWMLLMMSAMVEAEEKYDKAE